MADLTREQADALDVARALAAAGVPVFVAPPSWPEKPSASMKGWQTTTPNPRYVDAWRPGMGLCAVMGHGLDLVDLDPRNGATASLDGVTPIVYGVAATPSAGWHLFVQSLGVRSRDDVLPGVDVKAGDADGKGRGFAFIPPTVRVSKVTGEPVAYRWRHRPALNALAKYGPGDRSGDRLAEIVRSTRQVQFPPADLATPTRYAVAALASELAAVAGAPAGRRNDQLNASAFAVARFVVAGQLDGARTVGVLLAAAREAGLPEEEARRTIRSAFEARAAA